MCRMNRPDALPIPEEIQRLSPEARTAWVLDHLENPEAFMAALERGIDEWTAWREAGNLGLPPGYVRAREFFAKRDL
jgi:hypothetical protein